MINCIKLGKVTSLPAKSSFMVKHLLAKDLEEPVFEYIIRMDAPFSLIGVINVNRDGIYKEGVNKKYHRKNLEGDTETFQLVLMPFNDGISKFQFSTLVQMEWVFDEAWKWYNEIASKTN